MADGRALPHRSRQRLAQGFATAPQNCPGSPPEAGCLGAGSQVVMGRGLPLAWRKPASNLVHSRRPDRQRASVRRFGTISGHGPAIHKLESTEYLDPHPGIAPPFSVDSPPEETGFEPLVPLKKGRALLRADRDRFPVCPANCETDGGTTSSNPACSSAESSANSIS